MKLRQYQKDLIFSLRNSVRRGNKKVVAVLPTGGGKTFTFTAIIKGTMDKGKKALILTDRVELLKQAGGALSEYDMKPTVLEAGSNPYLGDQLYTAMIETLYRRIKKPDYQYWLKNINLIIIDEAHMRSFDKLFEYMSPDSTVLAFTATPIRQGRKGQMGEYFDHLVSGVEIEYLVENGYLSKPRYYGIPTDLKGIRKVRGDFDQNQVAERFSKDKVFRGVSENLKKYGKGKKTLCFSPNIASSLELTEELSRHFQGVVRHLDSTMSKKDRENVLKWFSETPDGILSNVGILTKGFDQPDIEVIVLYRATQSLPLYLQMIGRGSRVHDPIGKDEFTILDFGSNIERHGFWHEPRAWSLQVLPDKEKNEGGAVLKNCKGCQAFIPVRAIECEFCGYIDEKEKEEQELVMLQELNPHEMRNRAKRMSLDEQVKMCKQKLIKPSWVIHNMRDFDQVIEFVSKMGYSPYWYQYNFERFWWGDEYLDRRSKGKLIIKTR